MGGPDVDEDRAKFGDGKKMLFLFSDPTLLHLSVFLEVVPSSFVSCSCPSIKPPPYVPVRRPRAVRGRALWLAGADATPRRVDVSLLLRDITAQVAVGEDEEFLTDQIVGPQDGLVYICSQSGILSCAFDVAESPVALVTSRRERWTSSSSLVIWIAVYGVGVGHL